VIVIAIWDWDCYWDGPGARIPGNVQLSFQGVDGGAMWLV